MSRRRAGWLVLPLLLIAAGCTAPPAAVPAAQNGAPPFAGCAALTAPPAAPDTTLTPAPSRAAGEKFPPLPDVELPCFTGGQPVNVGAIRGPAVINLWGSWCLPCAKELPAVQRYAQRAAGTVHVMGVDTRDDRASAQSLAQDLHLTFPTLFDPDEKLRLKLERNGLPLTLFVDGQGHIRYIYNSVALDEAGLDGLVRQHLGVTVP